MIEESTKKDIEKISFELLKQSKSLDVFPTPIDKILGYSDLVMDTGLDLSKVDKTFFEKLKEESQDKFKNLLSGLSKIRGFFDRREKKIYVDFNQTAGRKNFVKLHEVGHGVLPWQNQIMAAVDNDNTLLDTFEDQFEAEANYFASITLFQHDRFEEEVCKLSLNISSAMALAKKFGSSVHAALRNYVLKSNNKCALLVLTPINGARFNKALCEKRDIFYSNSFLQEFGSLDLPEKFGFKWDFAKDLIFKKRYTEKGKIKLQSHDNEELDCNYHFFNNGYNSFVFIFPKGESNQSKSKVILKNL